MKKLFTLLAIALFGVAMWSCSYDDDDLWKAVDDLDSRMEAMEQAMKSANTDIDACGYNSYDGKVKNKVDSNPRRTGKSGSGNGIVTSGSHCIDKFRNKNGLVESKPSCGHGL